MSYRPHPLRWYHRLARELVCWSLGHRWSWARASYRPLTREEYEREHQRTQHMRFPPNPYYPHEASWRYRCRRCRLRVQGNVAWYPLWSDLVAATRAGLWHAWHTITFHLLDGRKPTTGRSYYTLPRRYWPAVIVSAATEFVANVVVHLWFQRRRWPIHWLLAPLLDSTHALMTWLDARLVCYVWVAPDPHTPGSMGFHIDRRYYNSDSPMSITITGGVA